MTRMTEAASTRRPMFGIMRSIQGCSSWRDLVVYAQICPLQFAICLAGDRDADYNSYMDIHETICLASYRRVTEGGIAFAYPRRTVKLETTPA